MQKKYNFKTSEPKWQSFWEKEGIFKFNEKSKNKVFSIDTDPPTLSGKMHIGHVSSYTHEDIIARYHRMKGEEVFFPFGVDNNGLPTEKLVEKENSVSLFEVGRKKFIELCQKTVDKIVPEFVSGWQRIGISCDFSKVYSTISPEVQKLSQKYFLELYKQGRIYQKESPILWCPECQTAIAQAELEDKELETDFCDIEFDLEDGKKIVIATTRPELLASCVAIFTHPDDKRYKKLIGKTAIVPLFNQKVKILTDKKADPKKGTGLVMCCTFGDSTDVEWFFQHNLPLRVSINREGKLNELANEFSGLKVKQARVKIIEELKRQNKLKKMRRITHTVNIHDRCGTSIEILPTRQWFVKYLDLKKEFLKKSAELNWYPKYMKIRLDNWIKGLSWDWCVSRQRFFGVPIPVWYCKDCQKVILPDVSELPVDPMHTKPKKKCECGSGDLIGEQDVLDTWATSSLTPRIALSFIKDKKLRSKMYPMSLRPQAHDIINFWLFYTLARSYLHFEKLPFKDVFISGFVLDEKGEKMSKSKGNTVDPEKVLEQYGADAIRYWAAQSGMGEDIRYSEEEIKTGSKTVTKIWNASRFSLMHLEDYEIKEADKKNLRDEDKWIFTKLSLAIEKYCQKMDKYEYQRAKEIIDSFFWNNFCDNYLEIIKLRAYGERDRALQFTLYKTLLAILKLYAPIMPFITEEIYQSYFREQEQVKSIHQTLLPKADKRFPQVAKDFDLVIEAIAQIRKYKSEHKFPMNVEIEKFILKTKESKKLQKYLCLISQVMNIKEIRLK